MTAKKKFMLNFKCADGTFELIGPQLSRQTAINVYKRRFLLEYEVECPASYFGSADETELEDSAASN